MEAAAIPARLMFAFAEAQARMRWRLGQAPAFDAELPAGPFTTLVGFLPQSFAAELAGHVVALPALAGHFSYPPSQMHVTVRNLDGAELSDLPALLRGLPSICLRGEAFGFTRETLLLRVSQENCDLRRLRQRLDDLPGMRASWSPRLHLCFVNVLRLNGRVNSDLLSAVRRRRHAFSGQSFELQELSLVRTDKVGSPARTEVLDRYSLRRSPASR
jgi:hypothetical protein